MALGEIGLEPIDIEPPYPGLAAIDPAEKPHFTIFGEQIDGFVVLRFVDEIAVGILHFADLFDVLLNTQLVFEPFDPRDESSNIGHSSSSSRYPARGRTTSRLGAPYQLL